MVSDLRATRLSLYIFYVYYLSIFLYVLALYLLYVYYLSIFLYVKYFSTSSMYTISQPLLCILSLYLISVDYLSISSMYTISLPLLYILLLEFKIIFSITLNMSKYVSLTNASFSIYDFMLGIKATFFLTIKFFLLLSLF